MDHYGHVIERWRNVRAELHAEIVAISLGIAPQWTGGETERRMLKFYDMMLERQERAEREGRPWTISDT